MLSPVARATTVAVLLLLLPAGGCGPSKTQGGGPLDECINDTRRCMQLSYQTCVNGQWSETDAEMCAAYCDVALGCVECPPGGTYCDGDNVLGCDATGHSTGLRTTCTGTCVGGTCDDPCGKAAAELSYLGCDYFPTVTSNSELAVGAHFAIAVANPQTEDVTIRVTKGADVVVMDQSVKSGDLATIPLSWVPELKNEFGFGQVTSALVPNGAYKLTSSAPVTVYQFNPIEFQICNDPQNQACFTFSNDASLLLPSTTLTGHYIAIARESFILKESRDVGQPIYISAPGFISVVGVEPVTAMVSIKFSTQTLAGNTGTPQAFRAGQTGTFSLKQGDVLQILSASPATCPQIGSDNGTDSLGNPVVWGYCSLPSTDLTGTEVSSDHKVAVFGGHDCTFIPSNRWACDHLEEQMLPLESWGKDYIATHSKRTPLTIPDFWRVVSGADNNTISFDPPSVHDPVVLQRGEWTEFASTADFEATGTLAFQLVQYMTGQSYAGFGAGGSNPGDPAMSLAVPVEQYRGQYTFLAPSTYTLSYVNVACPVGEELELDGKPFDMSRFKPFGAGKYMAARIQLDPGTHAISGPKPFGISVYGLASYTSYMYPGGLDVKMINVQ